MIVLVGACGLERLGDALRRAGERVEVLPPTAAADIAAREPTRVATLRTKLDRWRNEVGAQLPRANPNATGPKK